MDCTVGTGGHSEYILKSTSKAGLICVDRDREAIRAARERLEGFSERTTFIKGNFKDIEEILKKSGVNKVNGILVDLGMSSMQLDDEDRGFSFMSDGPLDMRMDREAERTAADLVNNLPEDELADILKKYGEERYAVPIARKIVEVRESDPIERTGRLAEIVEDIVPRRNKHPATRTFQALRIAVNEELEGLEEFIKKAFDKLFEKGRMVVLSYHSLEDRIVKQIFRFLSKDCICPPDMPVCGCSKEKRAEVITKDPVTPSEEEIDENPRSRSAKLRAAQKVA